MNCWSKSGFNPIPHDWIVGSMIFESKPSLNSTA